LGSPPEKGGRKKNKKTKKQKKTLVLTLGSPPEKGGKKKTSAGSTTEKAEVDSAPENAGETSRRTDGRTDATCDLIYTSGCPWPKAIVKPLCEIQVPKLKSHILKITS
jgi:hypothetical protein